MTYVKIPLKFSGFTLSVSWLDDKTAKLTEVFASIYLYSPIPIPTEIVI